MTPQQNILSQLKQIIVASQPLATIYLYGSRARGNAKPDSDWDLLILLQNDKITLEIEQSITHPLYDFEFETGEVISPMIYSQKEWNSKYSATPFYTNVMNEGKLI